MIILLFSSAFIDLFNIIELTDFKEYMSQWVEHNTEKLIKTSFIENYSTNSTDNTNFISKYYEKLCFSKKLKYSTDYLYTNNVPKFNLLYKDSTNNYFYTYENTLTSKFIDYHNLLQNKHKNNIDSFHDLFKKELDNILIQNNINYSIK
jgi:hypothetical protein